MRISEHKIEYLRHEKVEKRNCPGSIEKKSGNFNKIVRTIGDISPFDINQFVVIDMKEKFMDEELSDSRISSLVGTLKSFLKYLKEFVGLEGIYDYSKLTVPRVRGKPKEHWTQQEIDEFINWLPEITLKDKRFKALCTLLAASGARINEVLGLARNTNLESHEAEVLGKGQYYRKIYWDDRAEHYIRLYQNARPEWDKSNFLFGTINKGKYSGKWDKGDINRAFRKISKQYGKHIHCHKFRTSFCSNQINAGMTIATVSKLMGHHGSEAIRTTLNNYYCPMSDTQAKEEYQKFTRKFSVEAKANITNHQ